MSVNEVQHSQDQLPDPLPEPVDPEHPASESQEVTVKECTQDVELAPQTTLDGSDPTPVDLKPLGKFTLYRPPSNDIVKTTKDDLPPDYFEPTAEEVKLAQASLSSRLKAYQDAPLLTENLRNQKEKELREKLPTATIRIKFADRSMLEKSFPSSSRIKSVYAFVRSCLREGVIAHKFVLFETPPRRDLKVSDAAVKEKSLFDLHLAPRSLLHFRFLDESLTIDSPAGPPPLLPEVLSRAIDLPQLGTDVEASSSNSPPPKPPSSARTLSSTGATSSDQPEKEKKISRLLKLAQGKR